MAAAMPRLSRFIVALSLAVPPLVAAGLSASMAGPPGQAAPVRSTRDGVFSAAQAARGEALFEGTCRECHSGQLWGMDWDGKTVADVYDFISRNMPESAPGSLSAAQVRDAIAFILSSNELPAGPSELPASRDDLKQIRIEPPAAR
jgi:hypothetical protein